MRYLNISIDDVSPHHLSSTKVLKNCFQILEKYPQCKFTLFVPTAYWRTVKTGDVDTTTQGPLHISKHPEFCRELINLPENNFEICYHGKYHGIPGESNNDEFRYLTGGEFKSLWNEMKTEMCKSLNDDKKIKNVVRPPGMYMSPQSIQASKTLDIDCLALSKMKQHIESYQHEHEKINNVVYANVWPPFIDLHQCVDDKIEVLYHACEWDRGYLGVEFTKKLLQWLSLHDRSIEFVFIEQLL